MWEMTKMTKRTFSRKLMENLGNCRTFKVQTSIEYRDTIGNTELTQVLKMMRWMIMDSNKKC